MPSAPDRAVPTHSTRPLYHSRPPHYQLRVATPSQMLAALLYAGAAYSAPSPSHSRKSPASDSTSERVQKPPEPSHVARAYPVSTHIPASPPDWSYWSAALWYIWPTPPPGVFAYKVCAPLPAGQW